MRKITLLTMLLLSAGLMANAQYRFGAKAGGSVAGMNISSLDSRFGFNGGVFGQYLFDGSDWAMQTEVLFNLQGAKYDYGILGEGKINLAYISIPVMAQYYIMPGLSLEAGPQFGFMTSAKEDPDNGGSHSIKDNMKKFDFALNFGASYELQMLPVGFYARYSLGLTDIYDKNRPVIFSDNGKNRVFQFGVFVKM